MSLGDPSYLVFLGIAFLLFQLLQRGQPRRVFLLAASYFFYFEVSHFYIAILIYVTLATCFGAKFMQAAREKAHAFALLCLVVATVLLPMVFFKYFKFALAATVDDTWAELALPVGISFYCFAALGYLIDVHLEVEDAEPSLVRIALFLAFFPVVTAGPIERGRFLKELDCAAPFKAEIVIQALRLVLIGLLMKVVLADSIAEPIDTVYADPKKFSALEQFFAVLYYPFYLYADFAGYSLIAIGSARLFGLNARANFQQPFFGTTIPEFWRRWHISLSSWVRDYLFTPLRMQWRHQGSLGICGALFLSFVILGIWHGAKWGFLFFGVTHGCYAVASTLTLPWRDKLMGRWRVPKTAIFVVRVVATFVLVALAFVFFRADTLLQAGEIFRTIISLAPFREAAVMVSAIAHHGNVHAYLFMKQFLLDSWVIIFLLIGDAMAQRKIAFERLPSLVQIIAYTWGLLLIISSWLTHYGSQPFVYYKF